jgi:uncharacterized membrane protein
MEVAGVQRALEKSLNPLVSVLPLCLFGAAVLVDFGALVSGIQFFGRISYWVVATSLLVGLVTLTVLLVDFTTAPVGSVAHRVRGLASASMTGLVVAFAFAWFLRSDGSPGGNAAVFLLELLAFLGALIGYTAARLPRRPRGLFEARAHEAGWPFGATR